MNQISRWATYSEMDKEISKQMGNIATGFVYLGYLFKQARDTELFQEAGYSTLYEYVQDKYNITRTQAIRFMQINDTYSIEGNSGEIDPKYIGYGSSKLTEMLGIPEVIREEIPVDVTVKELRSIKAELQGQKQEEKEEKESCATVAQTQENTRDEATNLELKNLVLEFFKQNKNSFKDYFKIIKENINDLDNRLVNDRLFNVIAPSKFKMSRLAGCNTIFNEGGIKAIPMGSGSESQVHTYGEFIKEFVTLFKPEEKNEREAWENNYTEKFEDPKPVEVKIKHADQKEPAKKDAIKKEYNEENNNSAAEPQEKEFIEKVSERSMQDEGKHDETPKNENALSCKFNENARCLIASKESCVCEEAETCMYYGSYRADEEELNQEEKACSNCKYNDMTPEEFKALDPNGALPCNCCDDKLNYFLPKTDDIPANMEETRNHQDETEHDTHNGITMNTEKEDGAQIEIQDYEGTIPESMQGEIVEAEIVDKIQENEFTIAKENVDQILNNFNKEHKFFESYIKDCVENNMIIHVKVVKGAD